MIVFRPEATVVSTASHGRYHRRIRHYLGSGLRNGVVTRHERRRHGLNARVDGARVV
jgi:hypothetical protein